MNIKEKENGILSLDTLSMLLQERKSIYFIGIGGIGMSALARVLIARGYPVCGSDVKETETTQQLAERGCAISVGHNTALPHTDMVIYSSAITPDNPQLREAKNCGLPIFHRSELLWYIMKGKTSIGITGTHGKTTTSAIISFLLQELKIKPTCIVGGSMVNYHSNALAGKGDIVIAEVDESDKSLINLHPSIAVITNLDEEHLDIYNDLDDIKDTLVHFIQGMGDKGVVIYNYDDDELRGLVTTTAKHSLSFGFNDGAVFQAKNILYERDATYFDLFKDARFIDTVKMPLLGAHNVSNVLAVFAALAALEIDTRLIVPFIISFRGIERRMEIKYQDDDVTVIDDYAHHPTEIAATIQGLLRMKKPDHALQVVFQPHRFSRTMHLGKHFGSCFDGADRVIITDIYSAGEDAIQGIDEKIIYNAVHERGTVAVECIRKDTLVDYLRSQITGKTLIVFLGAGNITDVAHEFSNSLKNNRT